MSRNPYAKRAERLNGLFGKNTLRAKNRLAEFLDYDSWERIVGPQIAEHCSPGPISNKELLLYVENSLWMNELQLMKEQILAGIHQAFPRKKISGIRFRLGPVFNKKSFQKPEPVPAPPPVSDEMLNEADRTLLAQASAGLNDESLREAFSSWMRRRLVKGK